MGRKASGYELDELRSLGIDVRTIRQNDQREVEELIDNIKQLMIREFRGAYYLKENKKGIETSPSI